MGLARGQGDLSRFCEFESSLVQEFELFWELGLFWELCEICELGKIHKIHELRETHGFCHHCLGTGCKLVIGW